MSKTTIGFNIHPTKTLRYLIKEGKTLVFKSRVNFDTGIGLDTYPMSTGEILEKVCKMYTDGFTEGNKSIKAISDNVTYNTDAVTKGALYCISYHDGGFYVGLRTTEDYEPKEGDWWCIQFVKARYTYEYSKTQRNRIPKPISGTYLVFYDEYTNQIIGGNKAKSISRSYYMPTISQSLGWASLHSDKTNNEDLMYPIKLIALNCKDGYWGLAGNNTAEGHLIKDFNIDMTKLGPDLLEFKPITASDILAYNATGHMGWLMFGEELEISGNTSYNANKQFLIKNNVKYAVAYYDADNNQVEVDFATNNRYGAKNTIYNSNDNIYNIYATEKIGTGSNAIYVYQLDFESHYQDGVMERQITSEKRVEGETGAYHHIKVFPVLQDNRPATLNALNTNLLNSNQTDVQPINDETNG